jgi:ATP-dependent 26S proteasome regulatory subunit
MPLADDVDLDALSQYELTGGEIKNVVLNAARLAMMRNREGPLLASDFMAALEMERAHSWTKETSALPARIGFKHA